MINKGDLIFESCMEFESHLDICASELFSSKFGKIYYPSLNILINILYEANKKDYIYIARYHSNIVGFIWFSKDTMFGKFPYLNLIFVFERYRKLGIGECFLNYFEKKSFENYKNPKLKFFLVVKDDNINAIKFYEKNDYYPIGAINGLFRKTKNEILMMKQFKYTF